MVERYRWLPDVTRRQTLRDLYLLIDASLGVSRGDAD